MGRVRVANYSIKFGGREATEYILRGSQSLHSQEYRQLTGRQCNIDQCSTMHI